MKKNLKEWLLKYSLKVAFLYGFFSLTYYFLFYYNLFQTLKELTAYLLYLITISFFEVSIIEGTVIVGIPIAGTSIPMNLEIVSLCLGWFPVAAFFAMIWSLPVKEKLRLKSLLIGIPVLLLANFFRLVLLVFISAYFGKPAFDLFHHTIGTFDLMLLVVVLFIGCVHFVIGKKELFSSVKVKNKE